MNCPRAFTHVVLAATAITFLAGSSAIAQPLRRTIYNPTTQRMEPEVRSRRLATWTPSESIPKSQTSQQRKSTTQSRQKTETASIDFEEALVETAAYEDESYYEDSSSMSCNCDDVCTGCGSLTCGDCISGNDSCCGVTYIGFEAVFLKPHFSSNEAYTLTSGNGTTTESLVVNDFDYDMDFNPRVIVGWQRPDGLGLRATWWYLDHSSALEQANPPANGFGSITPPSFADVAISTSIPTDVFSTQSSLNSYAIDVEATHEMDFRSWVVDTGFGVRYAFSEQQYLAEIRSNANVLRDRIGFVHSIQGFGPTISLAMHRPWSRTLGIFGKARGSLVFGDGDSSLNAGEDLDLANSFTTTQTTGRDDLLSIGEIQIGINWKGLKQRHQFFQPYLALAMEGQVWSGAGNASSEEGDLGYFGFTSGWGLIW